MKYRVTNSDGTSVMTIHEIDDERTAEEIAERLALSAIGTAYWVEESADGGEAWEQLSEWCDYGEENE